MHTAATTTATVIQLAIPRPLKRPPPCERRRGFGRLTQPVMYATPPTRPRRPLATGVLLLCTIREVPSMLTQFPVLALLCSARLRILLLLGMNSTHQALLAVAQSSDTPIRRCPCTISGSSAYASPDDLQLGIATALAGDRTVIVGQIRPIHASVPSAWSVNAFDSFRLSNCPLVWTLIRSSPNCQCPAAVV
jgi:hypothetical protein